MTKEFEDSKFDIMISGVPECRSLRRGIYICAFDYFLRWNALRKRLVDVVGRVAHI